VTGQIEKDDRLSDDDDLVNVCSTVIPLWHVLLSFLYLTMYLTTAQLDEINNYIRSQYNTDLTNVVISLLRSHQSHKNSHALAHQAPTIIKLLSAHPEVDKKALRVVMGETASRDAREDVEHLAREITKDKTRTTSAFHANLDVVEGWDIENHFGVPMRAEAPLLWGLVHGIIRGRDKTGGTKSGRATDGEMTSAGDSTTLDQPDVASIVCL
jgi:hypothetical protein